MSTMKKQIIIAGPTASGKTSLAIKVAKAMNAEIISVDSRQCYKYLDIGTAKPTNDELQEVRHHNISILDPDQKDTAADFKRRVDRYTADIESRGKSVVYCGGSSLHLQSLIRPLDDMPASNKLNIKKLNRIADEKGITILFDELLKVDPDYAEKMDGMNRQRIIRALDVWHQTGRPFSSFHSNAPFVLPVDMEFFALNHPRKNLHERISTRTEQMIKKGLVEETVKILEMGFDKNLQSLQTVGYREVLDYLDRKLNKREMIEKIKTSTRRYAKRQITWLKRWPFVTWLDMDDKSADAAGNLILRKMR